jgi:hypothetical protein
MCTSTPRQAVHQHHDKQCISSSASAVHQHHDKQCIESVKRQGITTAQKQTRNRSSTIQESHS